MSGSFHNYSLCTETNTLLPATTLKTAPPSKMLRAGSVVTGLAFVFCAIPFCSYVREDSF